MLRIERAIKSGERIVVYGDFDADGVTSTALLTLALRHFGAKVEPYVPNRVAEGYGLNTTPCMSWPHRAPACLSRWIAASRAAKRWPRPLARAWTLS